MASQAATPLRPASSPIIVKALAAAAGVVGARVRLQAYTLSVADGFLLVAWGCVVALLLIATLRPSPLSFRKAGFQEKAAAAKDHS